MRLSTSVYLGVVLHVQVVLSLVRSALSLVVTLSQWFSTPFFSVEPNHSPQDMTVTPVLVYVTLHIVN